MVDRRCPLRDKTIELPVEEPYDFHLRRQILSIIWGAL
jgi:hypothetical protein